jgi:hypothetical protein
MVTGRHNLRFALCGAANVTVTWAKPVKIILSDIGWINMIVAVSDAMKEAKVYPQPGEP